MHPNSGKESKMLSLGSRDYNKKGKQTHSLASKTPANGSYDKQVLKARRKKVPTLHQKNLK